MAGTGHFAVTIGQGSNLNQAEWQRVHQRLITLGYRGVNNVALQVRPSPNQNTEQAIRRFRTRNGISPVTGRITRNDRTHVRLLSANAIREVTPAPAPQTRVVTPPPTSNLNQTQIRQVQDRLRFLGYRGQNNTNLQTTGSLNVHTNNALAHFRRVNNLVAATVLRSGDATWNRLFGNGMPAPLIAPDWHNVHTRLRNLGYRGQNGSALPIATSRTNNTNHALAQFRQRNTLNATTNFNRLDATWNRLFSSNARGPATGTNASVGGTTAPRPPAPPQPTPGGTASRPSVVTTVRNTVTTALRNAREAVSQTIQRCVEFLRGADWARVGRGVGTALLGIGGIVLGKGAIAASKAAATAIIAVSAGVLAPLAVPISIGISVWGIATIATGVSNLIEGLQDIFFGLGFTIGGRSPETSLNPIRDTIFRGNATLFNIVNTVLMVGSGAFITLGMFGGSGNQNNSGNNDANRTEMEQARDAGWVRENGETWWPPNDGAVPGSEEQITLQPGDTLQRIGSPYGRYVAPNGTHPSHLSLSPDTDLNNISRWEVISPIPNVGRGLVAPWFNQPGGGVQFLLPCSLRRLESMGIIRRLIESR